MTLKTKLTVQRPQGQSETFQSRLVGSTVSSVEAPFGRADRLYSYQVLPGNVLKIYSHDCSVHDGGEVNWNSAESRSEIAHFRPNQWDSVRSG